MAAAAGCGSWAQLKGSRNPRIGNNKGFRVNCVCDPYKTLRIRPGASESEVRKAFRQLALQYHPDVCRGTDCSVEFHQINEAYDVVMSHLRNEATPDTNMFDSGAEEPMRGMCDQDWDMWEEWMGWEGAGIRDYSSHINPYI